MARSFRPRTLAAIGRVPPKGLNGPRHEMLSARLGVEMERAALKLVRDIAKRRARALLEDPGQLEMIAPGLSEMTPHDMVARVAELRRAMRSLRRRSDDLVGRVDVHNLNAAALVARLLRRVQWRGMLVREAA